MPRCGRSTPEKENHYPFYRRLGGWPMAGLAEFADHRAVQPIASRCADCAILATLTCVYMSTAVRYERKLTQAGGLSNY
jgi:hypothetical protein